MNILPEWTFDVSEVQPLPPGLGKTETPVHVLPEFTENLPLAAPIPVLQLLLFLQPGAKAADVASDLVRLWKAINDLELSYQGAGLTPGDATSIDGAVRLIFQPTDPAGAAERLARLVSTINMTANNAAAAESLILQLATIERCEAAVVKSVAA